MNLGFEQTVGTFVDGIYFGRGQLAGSPFFDLQRVEVLKGPQSIYFGKNTTAGAFSIITANPTFNTERAISTLYEPNHGEKKLEGYFNGALTPTLAGRLAYRVSDIDGWLVHGNPSEDDEPSKEQTALRLSLSYVGIENLSIVTKVAKTEFNTTGRHKQLAICSDAMIADLLTSNNTDDCSRDGTTWAGGDFIAASGDGPGYNFNYEGSHTNTTTFSVDLNYTVGDILITSLTGYSAYKYGEDIDADNSPLNIMIYALSEDFSQLSEELRIRNAEKDVSNWMLGLYVQRASLDTTDQVHLNYSPFFLVGTHSNAFSQDSSVWSIFADWSLEFESGFGLNLGVRYTRETKEANKHSFNAHLGGNTAVIGTGLDFGFAPRDIEAERTESGLTPMAVIKYSSNVYAHYYASVNTGFKSGGYDYTWRSENENDFGFEEESVLSYELGSKHILLDGRADLQVALFYSTFEDIQSSAYDGGTNLVVGNAGEILSQGVEVSSHIKITSAYDIGFSYGYLNSKYELFDNAACYYNQTVEEGCSATLNVRSLTGERTQFSPEHSVNLYLATSHNFMSNIVTTRLDINYVDEFAITNDLDPRLNQPAHTIINFRLGYTAENYGLALLGKNLTNSHISFWSADVPFYQGTSALFSERFRSIALQYTYSF